MENYLQIMQQSLCEKKEILTAIEEKSRQQAQLIAKEDFSLEEIDKNMDEKSELIDKLTLLDNGFDSLYEKVRQELNDNKELYREQIKAMQELISGIMEKSASIEALEARNKAAIEEYFRNRKKELKSNRRVSDVAYQYYKSAKNLEYVDSQFLDQKK
ncbi:MAG: flagellar protein FliT [Lachnospiraceae bacterium]|nr:flagellar protein FliT [Lachnospiraceae bacterium]